MMVSLTGDKELIAKLKQLKNVKVKQAFRKGSRAASKRVQATAQANVPVVTGALKRSIKVRALPRSRKWVGTQVKLEIRYGSFVNLGTSKMKGRGYLQAAFKANKSSALDIVTKAMKEATNS